MSTHTTTPQQRACEIYGRAQLLAVEARPAGFPEIAAVGRRIEREFASSSLGAPAGVGTEEGTPAERLAAIREDVLELRDECDAITAGPTRGSARESTVVNSLDVSETAVLLKSVGRVV